MKLRFEIEVEPNAQHLDDAGRKQPPREFTREFLGEEIRILLEDDAFRDGFWVEGFLYDVKKVVKLDP